MMGGLVAVEDPGYIECTYNVRAAGKQSIMYSRFSWLSAIVGMEVDGVPVPVDKSYQFETAGEHVVRFYLPQMFEMMSMFSGVNILTGVAFHINPLVRVQLFRTFYGCTDLRSVDFGDSYVWCDTMDSMFYSCTKNLTVDISKIHLLPEITMETTSAFYNSGIREVVFGEVDKMRLNQTFWGLKSDATLIDFTRVKAITYSGNAFVNGYQPAKIDFGYCDLSAIALANQTFLEFYGTNTAGTVIMLGKPFRYTSFKAKIYGIRGTLIYNLEHDYSDVIDYAGVGTTPQAYAPVEKTLRVRFCTNDAWVTDPSAEFVINGVRGAYVSQGIWVFGMTAETYKYPVFYNGAEIGEAIVKDDVQNVAFGTNDAVYKVIDFSAADSFDPSVIVENDGWAWYEYQASSYFGLASNKIALGEKTSVTINTGMSGDIRLTLAQSSQTHYHFGKIYNSAGVLLKNMNGNGCQSFHIVGDVQSEDGILTFTYEKDGSSANGQDRMYIKKIESYNWPAIPAE